MPLRLFAPRKPRLPTRRPSIRLQLEQLEEREVLNASLVGALNYITYSAYQTTQQLQQAQTATQNDLTHFQQDAASFTAGQGVTTTQINNDLATLKQDVNTIQGLNATFQKENDFFLLGVVANVGSFSSDDAGQLLVDAYYLRNWQSVSNSAQQIANTASSVKAPQPPPPPTTPPPSGQGSELVTLNLNPLNVNLLGLQLHTDPIQVNISAQQGQAELLGNLLGDTANLLNLPAVNNAVNNVLGSVVTLANSGTLSVSGLDTTSGPLSTPNANTSSPNQTTSTTPVLDLYVAPVTLNLLGAVVTTSPIHLTLTAQAGQSQVLGNTLTDLANLFNPPLPNTLSIDDINTKLGTLLDQLNQQIPGIGTSPTQPPPLNNGQFLNLTVAPINLNLLGLNLQTSQIQVNATNQTGNGDLLGNITTTLLNTLGATPTNLATLNGDLNAILGKVVGVLNASTLTLPTGILSTLSPALQELALPNLVNPQGTATAPILNLAIASTNDSTPPVNVNLLGLDITTSNIQAQLIAQTGDGQILGNLLYNVANLLNPGGSLDLLPILNALAL
ncbi:MAG TPA: hypothetical protein VN688_09160 [Gemmataceae bacterium]|nr:hypothetical protein [Gemmataceae bacterium]